VILGTVPVTLVGLRGKFETFVLMEPGAAGTLIDADVAREIGLTGHKKPLRMRGVGKTIYDPTSRIVEVGIRGTNEKTTYMTSEVRTVKKLGLSLEYVNVKEVSVQFPYLRNFDRFDSMAKVQPMIIIGEDMVYLYDVHRPKTRPTVTQTRLGWMVHGSLNEVENRPAKLSVFYTDVREKDSSQQSQQNAQEPEVRVVSLPDPKKSVRTGKLTRSTGGSVPADLGRHRTH
jgi:hypothetical protein